MDEFVQLLSQAEGQLKHWPTLLLAVAASLVIVVIVYLGFVVSRLSDISGKLRELAEKVQGCAERIGHIKNLAGHVPQSVTFGNKVIQIPSLEEMGIPLSGLGLVSVHETLKGKGYYPCWINRGDPLLTYEFRFFAGDSKTLFSRLHNSVRRVSFEINSPVSGLLLSMREEQTVDFTVGLQYQWCNERLLPVILVPNEEPLPDESNFYNYDRIAAFLSAHFDLLPIRDHSKTSPERLRSWIDRNGGKEYLGYLDTLKERNGENYRSYKVMELTREDRGLISMIQGLRSRDSQLREKLAHLAREYSESI